MKSSLHRISRGRALFLPVAIILAACSTDSGSTTVSANGQTGTIPCPGSGCVGGFEFVCDSDGNSNPAGKCADAGPVDGGADGH